MNICYDNIKPQRDSHIEIGWSGDREIFWFSVGPKSDRIPVRHDEEPLVTAFGRFGLQDQPPRPDPRPRTACTYNDDLVRLRFDAPPHPDQRLGRRGAGQRQPRVGGSVA
jgi:hypothetical protein